MVSLLYKGILPIPHLMEKTEHQVQHAEKNLHTKPRIWGKYLQNFFSSHF